jgi:hypothetical protein
MSNIKDIIGEKITEKKELPENSIFDMTIEFVEYYQKDNKVAMMIDGHAFSPTSETKISKLYLFKFILIVTKDYFHVSADNNHVIDEPTTAPHRYYLDIDEDEIAIPFIHYVNIEDFVVKATLIGYRNGKATYNLLVK